MHQNSIIVYLESAVKNAGARYGDYEKYSALRDSILNLLSMLYQEQKERQHVQEQLMFSLQKRNK